MCDQAIISGANYEIIDVWHKIKNKVYKISDECDKMIMSAA